MSFSILFMFLILSLFSDESTSAQDLPQLGRDPLEQVIQAMSLEEKVDLLVGMGFAMNIPGVPGGGSDVPEKVPGASGRTHAIPRLGIPSLTLADGPAGVRINPVRDGSDQTYHATAFPVATLLASSWDPALLEEVGAAFGHEALEYGVDILLAPALNIHRHPLGGRNFEYYSEDPVLSGEMAAAFINGVESAGVGTSPKHFAANNQEFNRMQLNTIVGTRALREIYLRGFEIAVKQAQPWTIMSAYNLINGTYAPESADLLTIILRDEWGFAGFVMSDWFGGRDAAAMMRAGNDVLMPGTPAQKQAILGAVKDGSLDASVLDRNVASVLRIITQSPTFRKHPYTDRPDLARSAALARRAAAESMVLLKNENRVLPLSPSTRVALFGNAGYDPIVGGTGSGDVNEAYSVSPAQGLEEAGFTVHSALKTRYQTWIEEQKAVRPAPPMPFMLPPPIPEMPVGLDEVRDLVQQSDVAVFTLGRNSGEFQDRGLENDFYLSDLEQGLIRDLSQVFRAAGKPMIVVINVGGITEIRSWEDQADAILLAWQPGQEGGHAIADLLSGRVNPSGKLASTIPVSHEDVSSNRNFPGEELPGQTEGPANPMFGRPSRVVYEEGIFVGYRYFDVYDIEPAYPFGHGLSYTEFAYSEMELPPPSADGSVTATITVTNVGDVAGKEVVQLYVAAPADRLSKPPFELKAFAKTVLLEPGASQLLSFVLSASDFASFDPARSAWVADAGAYTVGIGFSSRGIQHSADFRLPAERVVEQVSRALEPQIDIDEMTGPKR